MKHVVVLCGGRSAEHDISLLSASSVVDHLDKSKYNITVLGIQKDGSTYSSDQISDKLKLRSFEDVQFSFGQDWISLIANLNLSADIVFPVLHGPFGEDGTVQGVLEVLNIAYVGSDVWGSAVGMNKVFSKEILHWSGLPTLPWTSFSRSQWQDDSSSLLEKIESSADYPIFVKPANLGSSIGISKSAHTKDLSSHIEAAFQYDDHVLCEQGIEAREIELAVVGNDNPEVSVPGEIIPSREFYNYEAKYIDQESELLIPASLSHDQVHKLQHLALASFKTLRLGGMARIDFLLNKSTKEIWINEVNTIPGFTRISMYPRLWEASGISYKVLLDKLIQLGLEKYHCKQRFLTEEH